MRRRIVQLISAAVLNPFIPNLLRGAIHSGRAKHLCVPALNCYSCPAAFGACPIGSLQVALSSVRGSVGGLVDSAAALATLYVAGAIMLVGAVAGRFACGWLCPFGFVQELLYRRRGRKTPLPSWAPYVKYAVLAVFVVLLPLLLPYPSSPLFCKLICPAGTIEAGAPLVLHDKLTATNSYSLGLLFVWKVTLAVLIMVAVLFISRFFCRTVCPLGAAWGLFNRASLLCIRVDQDACTKCDFCRAVCPVDISIYENPDSAECVRCLKCLKCPEGAVKLALRTASPTGRNMLAPSALSADDYGAHQAGKDSPPGEDHD